MTGHQYATIESRGSVYKPLYPAEGGPLGGFLCCQCNAVTRTKKGMIIHLAVVHGIRIQLDLKFEPEPEAPKVTDVGPSV